jgi:LAO/AO transport system kinase
MNGSLVERVLAGDFRAVARLITLVENGEPEAVPFMRRLFPHTGKCLSIGITGAPGVGKSTLADRLAAHYRSLNQKVGIVAVDPTSPFTGGAILGDRIRMQSRSLDPGTFIRSMATRGNLGGLSRATVDVLLILDAAGFDVVLIETVGVGQDEVEIARTAQLTMVLLVPGMGDDVQTMKAGIMEIGDIFVINKADHAGVERIEAELNALIAISSRPDGWRPEVVRTVAPDGIGVDRCVQAVQAWCTAQKSSPFQHEKALQIQRQRLLDLVRSEIQQSMLREPLTANRVTEYALQIAERRMDPYSAAERLLASWREAARPVV